MLSVFSDWSNHFLAVLVSTFRRSPGEPTRDKLGQIGWLGPAMMHQIHPGRQCHIGAKPLATRRVLSGMPLAQKSLREVLARQAALTTQTAVSEEQPIAAGSLASTSGRGSHTVLCYSCAPCGQPWPVASRFVTCSPLSVWCQGQHNGNLMHLMALLADEAQEHQEHASNSTEQAESACPVMRWASMLHIPFIPGASHTLCMLDTP